MRGSQKPQAQKRKERSFFSYRVYLRYLTNIKMKKFIQYIGIGIVAILAVILIAVFALAERDKKLTDLVPLYTNNASKFIPVLGMQVHYRIEGVETDTVPLVLIHGTSSSLHTWDSLTLLLSGKKKIIRFDLPAFGLTGPNKENTYNADVYNIMHSIIKHVYSS